MAAAEAREREAQKAGVARFETWREGVVARRASDLRELLHREWTTISVVSGLFVILMGTSATSATLASGSSADAGAASAGET
jgi:hypothetical protein